MHLPPTVTRTPIKTTALKWTKRCANGEVSCPEFQRDFEWKPNQVRNLVKTMLENLSAGGLTLYSPLDSCSSNVMDENGAPIEMIVDGQQRSTAMCIAMGVKPWWMAADTFESLRITHSVLVNVVTGELSNTTQTTWDSRNTSKQRRHGQNKVLLADICGPRADIKRAVTQAATASTNIPAAVAAMKELQSRIRSYAFGGETVSCGLDVAVEQFRRLNTAGRSVAAEDIVLSVIALSMPNFVNDHIRTFQADLARSGHDVRMSLLVRSLMALLHDTTRFAEVSNVAAWQNTAAIAAAWTRVEAAWRETLDGSVALGVTHVTDWGAGNLILPLVAMSARWPGCLNDRRPYAWMLAALREQRYKSQQTERLADDYTTIAGAATFTDALDALWSQLQENGFRAYSAEELRHLDASSASARAPKLVLHMKNARANAKDWIAPHGLLHGAAAPETQWHHVAPANWVAGNVGPDFNSDVFSNLAEISATANRTFSDAAPHVYFTNAGVDVDAAAELLAEQDVPAMILERGFDICKFLDSRAAGLAATLNEFINDLAGFDATGTAEPSLRAVA